jgi:predicted flap endonuclease-1-like 5' DNA nuclease
MTSTTIIAIAIAIAAALLFAILVGRRRGGAPRVERRESEPYVASTERPYMKAAKDGAEGNGLADEVAAAATDVAGEVLGVEAHRELSGAADTADDLTRLKGVGPKMVARLHELGVTGYAQLAGFNQTELAHLDERMGAFKGRLGRDRVAEQADYLARGDVEGFEEKFGKLG